VESTYFYKALENAPICIKPKSFLKGGSMGYEPVSLKLPFKVGDLRLLD